MAGCMAGEIYRLITREDAWRMWKPYGERIDIDGSLDIDNITPFEAESIFLGASADTQVRAYRYFYDEIREDVEPWWADLRPLIAKGAPGELLDILLESHQIQQAKAEFLRQRAIERGSDLVRLLSQAAHLMAEEDTLTHAQADKVDEWLIAPDGTPFVQYTPMSKLELGRIEVALINKEPAEPMQYATDLSTGTIWSVIGLSKTSVSYRRHNRVHESVHSNFAGLEVYDITQDDGRRSPRPTSQGMYVENIPITPDRDNSYGDVDNAEVTEGWTEYIAIEAMRLVSALGRPLQGRQGGYEAWQQNVGELRKTYPELYRRITDAMFAESTPSQPNSKREVIADTKAYADMVLGTDDSLTKWFRAVGGSLGDAVTGIQRK